MEQTNKNYNLIELVSICFTNIIYRTIHPKIALFNPNSTLTNTFNLLHRMRNEQDGNIT